MENVAVTLLQLYNNRVMVLENRRSPGKNDQEGQMRISVSKAKNSRLIEQKKIAVNG